MLARSLLPAHFVTWNARTGAPFGGPFALARGNCSNRAGPDVNAALQAGVAHAGPLVTLSKGAFDAAVRLGPTQPPPGGEELRQIASAIRPGGRLALSFRVRDGESVDLGAEWCLLRGDPSVIPGLAGFSSSRFANTAAWYGEQQHRIGVLLCGRVADAE